MDDDITAASLDARFALVPESANLRKVTYRVRRGETLYSVARRYRVDPKDVILWNHLTRPNLFAGQRLELTVPVTRRGSAAKKKPSTTQQAKARKPATAKSVAKAPARGGAGKVVAATR